MKALSLRQPWAWMAAHGHKPIENRRWRTDYRGPLLLHAAMTPDIHFVHVFAELLREYDVPLGLERGGIVGVATLVDCVTSSDSEWFVGPYGWVLADPRPLTFLPFPGRLGLFEVPDDLVRDQLG